MPAYTTETIDASGRRQVVAMVLFVVIALVTSYLPAPAQQRIAAALRSTVLKPFTTTQETLITARTRAVESDELRQRLDSLVAVMAAQGTLAEENRRLRAMLNLSVKLGPTFAAATLVRAGTAGSESTFLVDVGGAAGIHPDAPVISALGLVGVIRNVQFDHSIGMDWTHPDFRASAMTADAGTVGVVESRRGRFREEDRLVFNGTAFHTRLEDGTVVVTSGLGGVFPRGVPIGLIDGLAEAEGGWRKSYWLRPLVEPGVATHVLVAVGNAAVGPMDLTPVFPTDSVMTEEQLAVREAARSDSLAALGDIVLLLRQTVAALAARDSARTAGLNAARADSLAHAAAARLGAADSARRVDPPRSVSPTTLAPTPPSPRPAGGAEPEIRLPTLRPSTEGGGAGAPPPPASRPALPALPDLDAPARIRPADTTPAPRLPVPTDTIRLGQPGGAAGGGTAAVPSDTTQGGDPRQ